LLCSEILFLKIKIIYMKSLSPNLVALVGRVSPALTFVAVFVFISFNLSAQVSKVDAPPQNRGDKQLFIDVHRLEPGKVKYEEVARAHAKDLAVQDKYNVEFKRFWVDEGKGLVYCLSYANDMQSIRNTHAEAHGLIPGVCYPVTEGMEAAMKGQKNLFLDIHYLGAGKVTAKDVAAAHEKDLGVQNKFGVNFINYWVDEKEGVVMCLAEAAEPGAVIKTHKKAHGLVPAEVMRVKQGE
jgi:hypothetical protein